MAGPVRIHHLDCATMHPLGGTMVCHVLLLETERHLVLVDTGFGAVPRIRALGLDPADVRHVVLTHGDFDHVGGVADFPRADVHLTAAEVAAVRRPATWFERQRYRQIQWEHGPRVVAHEPGALGWYGFAGATALDDVAPGLLLVPLPGHTAGHAGVAIPRGDGSWLLHAGDAARSSAALRRDEDGPLVRWRQAALAHRTTELRATQRRLRDLAAHHPEVRIVTAHDRADLHEAQTRAGSAEL